MGKRGGIGTFLTVARLVMGNPVVRSALSIASKEFKCSYKDKGEVTDSAIYHALSMLAGEAIECPVGVRFLGMFVQLLTKLGVTAMGGKEYEVVEAVRDPALRRGIALVLKGLAEYGVTVPQKMPAPFLIVWNFTNMCNFRCKHCYQRADRPLPDELSLTEKLELIEQLDRAGVAAIALSGGEPTIHPDFLTVIKAIASRGIYAAVATNGWRLADPDFFKKALDAGLRYMEVSVDSADPKKHDRFRGVEGSWERAIKALENAVKYNLSHAMAVTITKHNINEVKEIIDLAQSIGVKRLVFFNFIPVGRGVEITDLDLSPEEREEFMRTIYKEMKRRGGIEIFTTAPQYGRVVLQLSGHKEVAPTHFYVGGDPVTRALAEFIGGCGAGRIYGAIQPNGDVSPCVFMPIKVGNIREKPFWEIWENHPLLLKLRNRDNLWGFCVKCPYRNVCGGCRARAYAYFGDPLGPDPGCIYNLKYWRKIEGSEVVGKMIRVRSEYY